VLTSLFSWKAAMDDEDLFLTVSETFASLNWAGKN
jgi:hypothetical protein